MRPRPTPTDGSDEGVALGGRASVREAFCAEPTFLVLFRAVSEPHVPRFLHLNVRSVQMDTYHPRRIPHKCDWSRDQRNCQFGAPDKPDSATLPRKYCHTTCLVLCMHLSITLALGNKPQAIHHGQRFSSWRVLEGTPTPPPRPLDDTTRDRRKPRPSSRAATTPSTAVCRGLRPRAASNSERQAHALQNRHMRPKAGRLAASCLPTPT